jgi:DNA-binding phage protein
MRPERFAETALTADAKPRFETVFNALKNLDVKLSVSAA